MNYSYFIQKHRVKIGVLVAVIIVLPALFFLIISSHDKEDKNQAEDTAANDSMRRDQSMRVFIKDFNQLQNHITPDSQKHIESRLYDQVSDGGRKPDLYTGTIREKSYSKESTGSVTITSFFVDIRPIKVTYRVTITTLQENSSVVVSCAPPEQQIDQSAMCEDPEYT